MKTKDCCVVEKQSSLLPLYVLLSGIFLLSYLLSYLFPSNTFMMNIMGVWFLAFGVVKLPDLQGFVNSFSQYDIIAKKWRGYGYTYPFIEILLGLFYLFDREMRFMQIVNSVALLISILGVVSAYSILSSGKKILCACMGTYWQLPMTKVTLFENGAMFLMLVYMMLYPSSMMNMEMIDRGVSNNSSTSTDISSQMREHCKMMPKMAGCEAYR